MTWGETIMSNINENTERDKSEAVSPSRPLIGWALRLTSASRLKQCSA